MWGVIHCRVACLLITSAAALLNTCVHIHKQSHSQFELVLAGADVVASGLATHLVPSQKLPELQDKLIALGERLSDERAIEAAISPLQVLP